MCFLRRMYPTWFASFILAALAWLLWAAPALAGGWVVISLDQLPTNVRAGETYRVGFTVLQHGITPMTTNDAHISARAADGQSLFIPAQGDGVAGHYVSDVFFPRDGVWTWSAAAGGFPPQSLGELTVLPAGAAVEAVEAVEAPVSRVSSEGAAVRPVASMTTRIALACATVCAAALFTMQLLGTLRARLPVPRPITPRAAERAA